MVPLSKWPGRVASLKTTSGSLSIAGLSHQTNHRRACHTHRNEHLLLHCAHRLSVKNELNSSGIFKSDGNVIMWFHFSFFTMLNFLNGRCQEPLMAPDITVKLKKRSNNPFQFRNYQVDTIFNIKLHSLVPQNTFSNFSCDNRLSHSWVK